MYRPLVPAEYRERAKAGRRHEMRYSACKECQPFIAALVKAGWRFSHGGKHDKLYSPAGKLLVVSRSPSDWRTLRNLRAEYRRLSQQP
jgi:hypothetical protein